MMYVEDLIEDLRKSDDEFAKTLNAWLEAMPDDNDEYDSCDWFDDSDEDDGDIV